MAGPTINPYRFGAGLGYRRDGVNRLYIRERHIDTSRGRWLSRDPIPPVAADFNFYWYAKNNPVMYDDPTGLMVTIGPVGPGTVCQGNTVINNGKNTGGNAVTGCNFSQGKMYTLICDTGCDAACTDAHEAQHRYDGASCCAKAKKCYDAAKTQNQKLICELKFDIWFLEQTARSECQAYRNGLLCREKMAQAANCYAQIRQGMCSQCCKTLIQDIQRDEGQIAIYCTGKGWPRPKSVKCPF